MSPPTPTSSLHFRRSSDAQQVSNMFGSQDLKVISENCGSSLSWQYLSGLVKPEKVEVVRWWRRWLEWLLAFWDPDYQPAIIPDYPDSHICRKLTFITPLTIMSILNTDLFLVVVTIPSESLMLWRFTWTKNHRQFFADSRYQRGTQWHLSPFVQYCRGRIPLEYKERWMKGGGGRWKSEGEGEMFSQ